MALKFSMILQAVDRITAPVRKARAAVSGWGASVRKVSGDIRSGARSMEHYQRRAERLRRVALGRAMQLTAQGFNRAAEGARRLGRGLADLPRRLRLVERAGNAARGGVRWLANSTISMAKWGVAATAAASAWAGLNMFKTAGQFEQYEIMLEGIEGSSAKAKKASAWVQKFAETTPYELDQVMEAFVALKAYGIDPMNGSLTALGDASSGMSKPLMQAVEALADAQTGEFERLKEFSIRSKKEGDKVTFSYKKNGKDISRTARLTGDEVEKALTGIFNERFGGGMERQAKSFFGILGNIKDLWSKFQLMVADAGIFDRVKSKLDEWRARLDVMAKDGRLKEWAQRISDQLEKAWEWGVKFVEGTDWAKVGADLKTIADALLVVAGAVVQIAQAGPKFRWALNAATGPVGWGRNLMEAWNAGEAMGKEDRAKRAQNAAARLTPRLPSQIVPLGRSQPAPARPASRLPSQVRPIAAAAKPAAPQRVAAALPKAAARPRAAAPWTMARPRLGQPALANRPGVERVVRQETKVGGKIAVDVKVKGDATARVAAVSTDNRAVPIKVNIGRSMRGAA